MLHQVVAGLQGLQEGGKQLGPLARHVEPAQGSVGKEEIPLGGWGCLDGV